MNTCFCEVNVSAWYVTVSVASCVYSSMYRIATLQGQYHPYAKECVFALENWNKDQHKHDMKLIVSYAFICSQSKSIWYAGKNSQGHLIWICFSSCFVDLRINKSRESYAVFPRHQYFRIITFLYTLQIKTWVDGHQTREEWYKSKNKNKTVIHIIWMHWKLVTRVILKTKSV